MSDKSRRSFLFGITVILVFCSFAAVDANRYMWIFISICAFMLLLINLTMIHFIRNNKNIMIKQMKRIVILLIGKKKTSRTLKVSTIYINIYGYKENIEEHKERN
ncbi:hypothetical protein PFMG_02019 [Plasmodium falciparum IGH-CR14]|uniref:Uncharacterized protein n=1 Tax=Plasmodium falciparum IGH-CR14 TaxID=580059 RepID=A0A0L1I9C7_PLAFA|nr:hypothetical protein PFMG_02019 [Plasmodium falciparum IGH-CR14]